MKVIVDCDGDGRPLKHFWRSTGFSPAKLLLNADMRQQMVYAGAVPHGGIRYVRVHYLLELVRAEGLGTDDPVYDWEPLDRAVEVLVGNGLAPFFEIMGNPSGYFTDFTDDVQVRAFKRLVRDLALHYIELYGADEVRTWYFETWNEPDGWWRQGNQAFFNYYDACSEGLKEADAELRFGGPGTCRNLSDLFKALMEHCDTGTNYFTGETGIRLDFISTHEKGAGSCSEDIDPDSMQIIAAERRMFEYLEKHHPRLSKLPTMNNECDPQVGWWDLHTWRGKAYHAAIAAKIINQHREYLADGQGQDYTLLSNDHGFVGAWGNRTLMARFGDIADDRAQSAYKTTDADFEEDASRRRFAMVKKPVLSVKALLALLGDTRCGVSGLPPSAVSDVGVIAGRRGDDQVAILVYHSADKIMSSGMEAVGISVSGIPFDEGTVVEYRIQDGATDPFAEWVVRNHRSKPRVEDLAAMRDAAELVMVRGPETAAFTDGACSFDLELPVPSVSLIVVSKDPGKAPAAMQAPGGEIYEGLHEDYEDLLLTWDGLDSRVLRSYEVLTSDTEHGKYSRINEADTIFTAWLHTRARGNKAWYKVRAVDYWGRAGEMSDPVRV